MDAGGGATDLIIERRVRNRLIEYFELASSFTAQREYEAAAPAVHIPHEVIEQWDDWTHHLDLVLLSSTVYSTEEKASIWRFRSVWEATVAALPDDYSSLSDTQAMPQWEVLRREAASALQVFSKRGRMSEE